MLIRSLCHLGVWKGVIVAVQSFSSCVLGCVGGYLLIKPFVSLMAKGSHVLQCASWELLDLRVVETRQIIDLFLFLGPAVP
jgi:hypothetical protein